MEAKEASKSINEKLSNCSEPARQRSIYKTHNHYLRDVDDNVHEPRVVAVGPYHHGRQCLKMMEEHKVWYLKSLLLRKNENVDRYISAAAEIEEEARSYYAEEFGLSTSEFIEMLVLDACFIIELLRKSQRPDPSIASDPIFQMEWIREVLTRDLILFENQIPFFVLCKLFDHIHHEPNQHLELIHLFFSFVGIEELYRSKGVNVELEKVRHLLHLTHTILRPSSRGYVDLNACPLRREFRIIPSATELKDANVTFHKRQGTNIPFEVDFNSGILTMPALSVDDGTDRFFRNLIFYEQYFPDNQATYVTDYVVLLDCLVNTGRDVEILSRCGIIENIIGDNQMAADIINRLGHSAIVSQTYFIHGNTFSRINTHYKRRWNRARAALNRDYFNTPWAYISFIAALLLLLLTLAQTVFSALGVF